MPPFTYGTLCSGIEVAAAAFPQHWRHSWAAEVDPFCNQVLAARHPGVHNYGDIAVPQTYPRVSLVVAGSPCVGFSIQGLQRGLDDPASRLALRFAELVGELTPSWFVWENVPGVLRIDGGEAFGLFLRMLAEFGYGLAYRVLDAGYFGVAQRRRRVYVVGNRGSWQRAAAVLFDAGTGDENAAAARRAQSDRESAVREAGGVRPILGWSGDETPKFGLGVSPTLRAAQGGEGTGFICDDPQRPGKMIARKFTAIEMERLQGLPDGYTDVPGATYTKRKKALGNAFCAPVLRWIGNRIDFVEELA